MRGTASPRLAIVGAPVARPLDFVDAFLGGDQPLSSEAVELEGGAKVVQTVAAHGGGELVLTVAIAPRHGAREAFAEVLDASDAVIHLVASAGWGEQEPAWRALESAMAATSRAIPVVRVVNTCLPPRLEASPLDVPPELTAGAPSGRICWWRHEKAGTEVARDAVARILRD